MQQTDIVRMLLLTGCRMSEKPTVKGTWSMEEN